MLKLDDISNLKGNLLIASPMMVDIRFAQSVVFMCESKISGAFGFAIRKDETLTKFKKQLKNTMFENCIIHPGGPVSESRLFVIHSSDVMWNETLQITDDVCVTNFEDAIKVAQPKPEKLLLVAGYANWQANQLEREMIMGFWIMVEDDSNMIFDKHHRNQWKYLMRKLDLNENTFAMQVGTS